MKKNLLVDTSNILYRVYYSRVYGKEECDLLRNKNGYCTSLIYGFFSSVESILRELDGIDRVILFVDGFPKKRMELYSEYKQYRSSDRIRPGQDVEPVSVSDGDTCKTQIAVILKIARYLGMDICFDKHSEADDMIASFVKENSGDTNLIVSSDKDFYQLMSINDRVLIYNFGSGSKKIYDYDDASDHMESLFKARVTPDGIRMFKALTGDASDNIKGVPRIRKKVAASVSHMKTVDEVINSGMSLFSKKEKENLLEMKEKIELNLKLIDFISDVSAESSMRKGEKNLDMANTILKNDFDIDSLSVSVLSLSSYEEKESVVREVENDWFAFI